MTKRALITGITGQDGSYLAELLLAKGYEVHGLIRRASTFNTSRIDHLYQDPHELGARLFLHYGDLSDGARLVTLLSKIAPDEVYNLAAQSHVRVSFDEPEHTGNTTGIGSIRLLEAVRMTGLQCRFYQASSSEMFGASPPPQNEDTPPFYPRSPYGAAKVYSYWVTRNYREAYGIHAVNGILFNHESPPAAVKHSSRERSRVQSRESRPGSKIPCTWAIWTRSGTGATHPSTSRVCGGCFKSTNQMTTCWPLEETSRSKILSWPHSNMWVSTGRSTSNSILATFAPHRGGRSGRRCRQGRGQTGLESDSTDPPRIGSNHDGRRHRSIGACRHTVDRHAASP